MVRIATLKPAIGYIDTRVALAPPKRANPFYQTPEWLAARKEALKSAGHRCERVVDGRRCGCRLPTSRLIVDHKVELQDGGAPFAQSNLETLCPKHHSEKTAAERAKRASSR